MRDRAEISGRHESTGSIRATARQLGIDRNTVRRAIAPGARSKYWRRSAVEDATEAVRDILVDYPHMAVTDVAVLIDWRHSRRALSTLVSRLRPEYVRRSAITALPAGDLQTGRLRTTGRIRTGTLHVGTMTIGR